MPSVGMGRALEVHSRGGWSGSAHELAGGEGEAGAEGGVPVFPVVDAVADTQLAGDALTAHLGVELEALFEEEVVVAHVDEPADGAELLLLLFGGGAHELDGGVVVDGTLGVGGEVGRVEVGGVVRQPGAHGIAGGEHVGMALGIDGAAAATHREAADGAVPFVADGAVALLDGGQELLIEELLVGPALHVEVAVPGGACLRTTGIGHDDEHGAGLAGADELFDDDLQLPLLRPGGIGVGEAVQEVEHGVLRVGRGIVALREIDVEAYLSAEVLAVDAVGHNLRPRRRHGKGQGDT